MTPQPKASPGDKVVVQILGPTGVGKSDVAIRLAQQLDGEIVSADSMQVYRGFDIGTATIPKRKRGGVPHHLIDILNDCSQYNAAKFLRQSFDCCVDIIGRGRLPIVCGGTALYLTAMIRGIFPEKDGTRISREKLMRILESKGREYLWERLSRYDPEYAEKVDKRDAVRIIRGLEIYYNQGIPPTEIFKKTETPFENYHFIRLGLMLDREELYARIEKRVDGMIASGLVEEVKKLRETHPPLCPPFFSLGYKEVGLYLDGDINLEEAVVLIKRNSRHFAKRQLSWFRREGNIYWFAPHDLAEMERTICEETSP